jgi:hypothetical protein
MDYWQDSVLSFAAPLALLRRLVGRRRFIDQPEINLVLLKVTSNT